MSELESKEELEELTLGKGPPTCTGFKVPAIHYNNEQEFESDEEMKKTLTSSAESTHLTSSIRCISH